MKIFIFIDAERNSYHRFSTFELMKLKERYKSYKVMEYRKKIIFFGKWAK